MKYNKAYIVNNTSIEEVLILEETHYNFKLLNTSFETINRFKDKLYHSKEEVLKTILRSKEKTLEKYNNQLERHYKAIKTCESNINKTLQEINNIEDTEIIKIAVPTINEFYNLIIANPNYNYCKNNIFIEGIDDKNTFNFNQEIYLKLSLKELEVAAVLVINSKEFRNESFPIYDLNRLNDFYSFIINYFKMMKYHKK